jgi:hypothetical protein
MQQRQFIATFIVAAAFVALPQAYPASQHAAQATKPAVEIPRSMQVEHETIHAALVAATKHRGRIGQAARDLADVLHPHFVREELIALPPLGLLARLASNATVTETEAAQTLEMTDSLQRELPRMLEEHKRIRAAVERLRAVAQSAAAMKVVELSDDLALHAQTEEEVMYPAAVLVGEVLRARAKRTF